MSCPKKRSDSKKRPRPTPEMREKDQVYLWKTIRHNPNLYCWIPASKRTVNPQLLSPKEVRVLDIPPPNMKSDALEKATKVAEKVVQQRYSKKAQEGEDIISYDDPKKYKVVKQFVKDRNLIMYGGVAINAALPRGAKIYSPTAIPDYDFYSPDPWTDANDLAQKLYDAGYEYTEVRSGVHKGTYKVFSNTWPVADVTYMPPDIFSELQTKKKQGIRMIGDAKIIADFYRQIYGLSDVYRWDKVAKRQKLFSKWNNPLKRSSCAKDVFANGKTDLDVEHITALEVSSKYGKEKKLVLGGDVAYNIYVGIAGGDKRLMVSHTSSIKSPASTLPSPIKTISGF